MIYRKTLIGAAALLTLSAAACGAEEAPLVLTPNGLGNVGGSTPYSLEAVGAALPGYEVASEEYSVEGDTYPMIVIRDTGETIAEVLPRYGDEGMVGGIVVKSADITFEDRISLGTRYADMSVAPADCVAGMEGRSGLVLCSDGKMPHIGVVFGGDWAGPDGELPPDDVLEDYTVQEITWSAGVL